MIKRYDPHLEWSMAVMVEETGGDYVRFEDVQECIEKAIDLAVQYGGIDGDHHKAWGIDQMVRALAGDRYEQIVAGMRGLRHDQKILSPEEPLARRPPGQHALPGRAEGGDTQAEH